MYVTFHWPEPINLPIPEDSYPRLIEQLTEGFSSIDEAHQFWNDTPTQLIILNATDNQAVIDNANDELQQQLRFVLAYPEFVIPLGDDYHLALAIFSDEGAGIYLLIHNDCPISQELVHA